MMDGLCYQGYQRGQMLKFLYRLCIKRYRDALLEPACEPCLVKAGDEGAALAARVADWCATLVAELERVIRDNPAMPADCRREGDAMILFHQEAAMVKVIAGVLEPVCQSFAAGRDSDCDAVLWRVLSQHFKAVMDQVDGLATGSGTHRYKTRRRIDRLRKTLEQQRGGAFASHAAAATALCELVVAEAMTNMPVKPAKMEEYLLELDADTMAVAEQDMDGDALIIGTVGTPEQLVLVQQCLERLPPELRQAVAIKNQWDGEPAFLRTQHMAEHYGFGWETVRKRYRLALDQLRDCLEI